MIQLTVIIIASYALFILFLIKGWQTQVKNTVKFDAISTPNYEKVSIIIPCRNEEYSIEGLLKELKVVYQYHPLLEIICVDDHSTDSTAKKIKNFQYVNYVALPIHKEGKKAAITEGILHATGNIIILIDADCIPQIHWFNGMIAPFTDDKIRMVCGWVKMQPKATIFEELVALEFSTLIAFSAAMNGLKLPVLCNGASLAFRKDSFEQVGGYNSDITQSGDDVFLLHKFKAKFGADAIHYMLNALAAVETPVPQSMAAFLRQRIRWVKKSLKYRDKTTIYVSLFMMFIHLWLLVWFIVSFFNFSYWFIFGLSWMGKTIIDILWMGTFAKAISPKNWKWFIIPLSVVHWLYVPLIAIISWIIPSSTWKGRILKNG